MATNVYSDENISDLVSGFSKLSAKYSNLSFNLGEISTVLQNEKAKEYLFHGALRRLRVLNRCSINIFAIFPPNRTALLNSDELADININLHAFFINQFGLLDNLAWVFVHEKGLENKIQKWDVGLFKEDMQDYYPNNFKDYLDSRRKWHDEHLIIYRDALAHRIPLYVPPKMLTDEQMQLEKEIDNKIFKNIEQRDYDTVEKLRAEQNGLGNVAPFFRHSLNENDGRNLHFQILADFNTTEEIINKYCEYFKPYFFELLKS